MKKLSLKNLKLESDDMLQREQLKAVFGGYNGGGGNGGNGDQASCKLYYTAYDGSTGFEQITFAEPPSSSDSTWANNRCVTAINQGWQSCSYDCNHDGWGQ